jgi:predicted cupin superfamily sugar epimerase
MVGEEVEMKPSFAGLLILSSVIASPSFAVAAPRPTAAALIQHFAMAQVPQEGPWFTLTYTSDDMLPLAALPRRYDGPRAAGSAIIGLITRTEFSAMHRLKTDEMWHYYGGDPLHMLVLHPDGRGEEVVLGSDVLGGQKLQYVVPRGCWQGAMPAGTGADTYSLFGDTLAPGFAYADFEMGYRRELQQAYPRFAAAIAQLTRKEFVTRP